MANPLKLLAPKKPAKDERERIVLLRLVDLFLKTGKPIASGSLRDHGLKEFSSATIRNYFAKLEQGGYLKQPHASGGRIPTQHAYRVYAKSQLLQSPSLDEKICEALENNLAKPTRNIAQYLQNAAAFLSDITNCAVFLSTPRFDSDFVLSIRLFAIDAHRCLGVLLTDFGLIHTETLHTQKNLHDIDLSRLEEYFAFRLQDKKRPSLSDEENALAESFYSELMLRHIVHHTNFFRDDLFKTGFSKLLDYQEYKEEPSLLANALSLFESPQKLSALLQDCTDKRSLTCLIGDDLCTVSETLSESTVISIPFRINQSIVGAIGLLGPTRVPYRQIFALLTMASELISETLTSSVYKFKISYRTPEPESLQLPTFEHSLYLENQSSQENNPSMEPTDG